ncbi:hypothetical protein MU852_09480 [Brevundimonas albigilva]|uniref:hypothetical protein n=1 Tax=Brevundimonas albigilva TaxID=1312364 RepID=UPI00201B89C9|nr:hypothetical protein [Brevundimonas albigilva]UQV17198.1 hypothetical protein MU852_09480 [Brevundimonas albigilva]
MDYERTAQGITYRGIRRAFRDEANTNPEFVARLDKALGGDFIALSQGAFMKNQGTDLHLIVKRPDESEGQVWLRVEIDKIIAKGMMDMEGKPQVKKHREGADRQVTIAPKIWFHHTGNAREAENRLTFEKLMKIASPTFAEALEAGIERADRTFAELMKPKSNLPWWAVA